MPKSPPLLLVLFSLAFIACSADNGVSGQSTKERYNSFLTTHDLVRPGKISPTHLSEQRRIIIETYEAFRLLEDGSFTREIRVAKGQRDSLSVSSLGLFNPLLYYESGQWEADYPILFLFDVKYSSLTVDNTLRTEETEVIERSIYLFIDGEKDEHRVVLGYRDREPLQYTALEKGQYISLVEK